MFRKDEIGLPREVPAVQAKSEAPRMQGRADSQLRLCILAPYAGHHATAHIRCHAVGGQCGQSVTASSAWTAYGGTRSSRASSSPIWGLMSRAIARTAGTTTALPNCR